MKHRIAVAAAVAAIIVSAAPALALAPPGTLEYEPSNLEGHEVVIQILAAKSSNPHQVHFACFALGSDLARTSRAASAPPLYVVLAPGTRRRLPARTAHCATTTSFRPFPDARATGAQTGRGSSTGQPDAAPTLIAYSLGRDLASSSRRCASSASSSAI
jgi:hypothetical protein